MRRHGGLLAFGWAVAAWLACSETETRPPISSDCNEPGCLEGRNGSPPDRVGAGAPGGGGEGGGAGTSGMPPPGVGVLLGTVITIVEPDLSRSGGPEIPLEIRARSGTGADIVGTSAADGSFRLDGVPSDEALWAAVGTFTDPGTPGLFMDTLQIVDAASAQAVELSAMRRSVMDQIAVSSFLNEPIELDPARGHAIIRFVDEGGNPVPDLRVVFPTLDSADIAYDAGEIYSETLSETSTRGTVALFNLVAPEYPGGVANVVVEIASPTPRQFSPSVRVASAAVTVLTVELELDLDP